MIMHPIARAGKEQVQFREFDTQGRQFESASVLMTFCDYRGSLRSRNEYTTTGCSEMMMAQDNQQERCDATDA